MAIPIDQSGIDEFAGKLLKALRSNLSIVKKAQSDVLANNYALLLNIPLHNKNLQDVIAEVTASGQSAKVITQISEALPSDITISDVQSFASALDAFSSDIETNAGLFLVTINATTKRPEFVTPVSAGVQSTIESGISAVLAEVS